MKVKDNYCRITSFVLVMILMTSGAFVNSTVGDHKINMQDAKVSYSDLQKNFVSIEVNAGIYNIEKTEQGHDIFVENFGRLLIPGKPNLPSKILSVAIPPGSKIVKVTFDMGERITFPKIYEISPSPLPRVIGNENSLIYSLEKQMYNENYDSTYLTDNPYPSSIVEFVRTSGYRKYNLVDVRVTPFTYQPLSGRLIYFPDITIDVHYDFPDDFSYGNNMIDNLPRSERIAEQIIFNYDQAIKWYPSGITSKNKGMYDFVIITLDSLIYSVSSLVDWETDKGRNVNVISISWINSNYDGYDLAEKIRNFLRDKYPSDKWGIEDVLLIGNYDDVPMRRTAQDVGYGEPETDFYYAELSLPDDQSWDADGDHQYGEYWDPIDFYSEVNVGRIPWSNPATVASICEKSVDYEQNNDTSFKKNILLLGAFFWDDTDNAVLMETKVDQPWMHDWTMTRMYEQGHSIYPMDYNLKNNNVVSVWSTGKFAFVNWAGHGSPTASYIKYSTGEAFISSYDCSNLNDNYPAIIFDDACSNSDTDTFNNIGKEMLKKGGVGFLGATKVAYGQNAWNSPYDGSSQSLDYFFTTCVTSGNYTQGEAHQWALREMYTNGLWYSNKYETFEWGALWGNPNLGMAEIILYDPPEILNVKPTPQNHETNDWINISCEVNDYSGVNLVKVNITYPDISNVNQTMINIPGTDTYYYNTTYSISGLYNFFIWADGYSGKSNVSEDYS